MPTTITFLYDNPADPAAFEEAFAAGHLDLARALPGVQRVESSKVWPKEDGTPTPKYRMVHLWFEDYEAACTAVTTAEAGELFPSAFGLATGGLTILFSEVDALP